MRCSTPFRFELSFSPDLRANLFSVLAFTLVFSSAAIAAPARTSLVSQSQASSTAAEGSVSPFMSSNGRYVVFRSLSPNLVEPDQNFADDLFVYDRTKDLNITISDPQLCEPDSHHWLTDATASSTGRYVIWGLAEYCNDGDEEFRGSMILLDQQTNSRRIIGSKYEIEYQSIRFSADSKFVVFESNDYGFRQVWLLELIGSQPTLISKGPGQLPTGKSYSPSTNSDGSLVAFVSDSYDLVPNDTNGVADIFVYRRATGVIQRVSQLSSSVQSNGPSSEAVISADGKFIAFSSDASNLVAGDTNNATDVFLFEVATGTITRVSKKGTGVQLNGRSSRPSLSSDAGFVAFSSVATNAVPDDTNDAEDIFLRDRNGAITSRLSVGPAAIQLNGASSNPQLSSDGRYVTFVSASSNLTSNDKNRAQDIFLLDRQSQTYFVATKASSPIVGLQANWPSVSADARTIAFESTAAALVANDTNNKLDVFVRDFGTNTTTRASVPQGGGQGNAESGSPVISADGRSVAFTSSASNLVPNDVNNEVDAFVRDRQTTTTIRANVSSSGQEANGSVFIHAMSGNGRFVLFSSPASNLVPGDTSSTPDLFIRDLSAGTTEQVNSRNNGSRIDLSDWANFAVSFDGRYVLFNTEDGLVAGDTDGCFDLYLKDRQTAAFQLISVQAVGDSPWCGSNNIGSITPNGRFVVFQSESDKYVSGDTNQRVDIFVRDRQLGMTVLASPLPANVQNVNWIDGATISDDGRYVAFNVETLSPLTSRVYYRDMQASITMLASRNSAGDVANAPAYHGAISGNGRAIIFISRATNLVPEPIVNDSLFMHEPATDSSTAFSVTPTSLAFGSVTAGTTSAAKIVTVSNTGTSPLGIKSVALAGSNPGQFKFVNNCPAQLEAGVQCTVSVRFKPTALGAKSAVLRVAPTVGSAKSVALTGTGK